MLAGGALRRKNGEQDIHWSAVDGVEGHAAGANQERCHLARQVFEGAVGDGDTVTDTRRLKRFALDEDPVEIGFPRHGRAGTEQGGQRAERVVFRLHVRTARGNSDSF